MLLFPDIEIKFQALPCANTACCTNIAIVSSWSHSSCIKIIPVSIPFFKLMKAALFNCQFHVLALKSAQFDPVDLPLRYGINYAEAIVLALSVPES